MLGTFKSKLVREIKNEPVLLSFLFILFVVYIVVEFDRQHDFRIFVWSSKMILKGAPLYDTPIDGKPLSVLYYYYSPLFSVLLAPFVLLLGNLIFPLWKLLSLIFFYKIWKMITRYLPKNKLSRKEYNIWVLFSLLFIGFFIYKEFHNVQVTIFIFFITLYGLDLIIFKKKIFWGVALLALAINIKILPVVFIPYFIWRKEWLVCLLIPVFLGVYWFLPSIFIGWDYNLELLQEYFKIINPLNSTNIVDLNTKDNSGISALFSAYLTDIIFFNFPFELKRHILLLEKHQLALVSNITRFVLISSTIFFIGIKPFQKEKNKVLLINEIGFIFLLIPLIFPQQRIYAFILFIITASYHFFLILYVKNHVDKINNPIRRRLNISIFFISLSFVLFNLELYLGNFREYYWFFKTVSIGAVIYLIPVYLLNYRKISHYLQIDC